jgi:type II secretory pathway component PulK
VAEEARVNLNRADRQLLAALFATAGGCGSNEAARIAAAVVERRRPAPEEGPGPAPSERGLTGPFESVYELLLVDGVTPGLFSQVEPRVTVFGEGSRIDINTADAITLESVARRVEPEAEAGIGRSLAAKVIGSRERGNVFTNRTAQGLCEALGRWETLSPAETQLLTKMAPVITVSGSRFRGRVGARLDRAPREAREIEFVWDPAAQRIRFWHED